VGNLTDRVAYRPRLRGSPAPRPGRPGCPGRGSRLLRAGSWLPRPGKPGAGGRSGGW